MIDLGVIMEALEGAYESAVGVIERTGDRVTGDPVLVADPADPTTFVPWWPTSAGTWATVTEDGDLLELAALLPAEQTFLDRLRGLGVAA
ncbi:hypothetical protein JNUCC0626_20225 [Lentzea sp. JNUCC 0626]|uniref:hypothetical protein n=1 Tax=Lentzea sp. JNUCC 0626 TaxID=3367513 RepID=UPI0037490FC5